MLRFLFVTFGQLCTLAATALMVLTNMGQLTENTVARHIYITSMNVRGIGSSITNTSSTGSSDLFASNQAAAELSNQGLKYEYFWGLYGFCAGNGVAGDRSCSQRYIGYRYEPATVLVDDATTTYSQTIESAAGDDGFFNDGERTGFLIRVANVILLVGTILTGLAFLTGFLAHRFCFAFAALQCLGAAGCLAVGAAMYTAVIYKVIHSIPDTLDVEVYYGNSLWFVWASLAAVSAAIIPLILACCLGRSKY